MDSAICGYLSDETILIRRVHLNRARGKWFSTSKCASIVDIILSLRIVSTRFRVRQVTLIRELRTQHYCYYDVPSTPMNAQYCLRKYIGYNSVIRFTLLMCVRQKSNYEINFLTRTHTTWRCFAYPLTITATPLMPPPPTSV